MTSLQALLLSLLQGATEFLPVSSSAHLVLAQRLFHLKGNNLAFDVLVHVGTMLSILLVFRTRLLDLVAFALAEGWRMTAREGVKKAWTVDPRGRMIVAILLATIPTGAIALVAKDFFEGLFMAPDKIGWALCITGMLLASTVLRRPHPDDRPGRPATAEDPPFPLWAAFAIGIMQGIAVAPGISRSGSTIAVALLLGLRRKQAWEFSFLISIPAILGALILETKDLTTGASVSLPTGILSLVTACVVGWVCLKVLQRVVRGGQFPFFSLYCFAVGIWAILWF